MSDHKCGYHARLSQQDGTKAERCTLGPASVAPITCGGWKERCAAPGLRKGQGSGKEGGKE